MEFIRPNTNIDFLRWSRVLMVISAIAITASLVFIIGRGFNYGIEFSGGVEMRVDFAQGVSVEQVREALAQSGLSSADVTRFKIEGKNVLSIKVKGVKGVEKAPDQGGALPAAITEIMQTFASKFGEANFNILSTDMIGARVGKSLREKATWAVALSLLAILAYLAFRFNIRYSPGAVVALAHDVIFVAGAFALTGREVNLTAVAALLTIAGYSVNDTIVIFDRIREGHKIYRGLPLDQMVNRCINDTLSRTLLTNFTVLLVILSMHLLGSAIIRDFTFAMLIGAFVGTYSTLYIASPIYIYLEKLFQKRRKATSPRKK